MRALVVSEYGPWDSHALQDLPDPVPGPGEIVVDTAAMSVNFPDVLMVEGLYQHKPPPPVIAGFDAAGFVSAVGPDVTRVGVGDRVLIYVPDGAFAERAVAREVHAYRIPDAMSFTDAAAFGLVYLTTHVSMIDNAACRAGETVLVTGASGGVGLA
ncbi:MAG: alcohol dehydrogenase catalytic domain-containing protein, partial [Pseudomonadota bacterium]